MAIESRVLGGLRFVDAVTESQVGLPLSVEGEGLRTVRNRRGTVAITEAPDTEGSTLLADWAATVEESELPELPEELPELSALIVDPSGTYQARAVRFTLPRPVDDPVLDVRLFRTPWAPTSVNWTILYGKLVDEDGSPLPGGLVRVREVGEATPPLAVTTAVSSVSVPSRHAPFSSPRTHGDVALAISGLESFRVSSEEGGSITSATYELTIEAIPVFDLSAPPDPDAFLSSTWIEVNASVRVASGQRQSVGLLTLPTN